jgi:hypothetical protein
MNSLLHYSHLPSDSDILAYYHLVRRTCPEYCPDARDPTALMSKNKLRHFRRHLRFH